jgi:hypothetical protein
LYIRILKRNSYVRILINCERVLVYIQLIKQIGKEYFKHHFKFLLNIENIVYTTFFYGAISLVLVVGHVSKYFIRKPYSFNGDPQISQNIQTFKNRYRQIKDKERNKFSN